MSDRQIYYNGNILTLEKGAPAEALLVEGGAVKALGSYDELRLAAGDGARRVDLLGRTLLPAFIDAHSHITSLASTLASVPLEGAKSQEEIAKRIRDYVAAHGVPAGKWVTGFGYDNNLLPGREHPDRRLLDAAAPQNPVVISHASGHMGVMNTQGLRQMGIAASTPDPAGGKIGRELDGEPSGYLEEAAFTATAARMPEPSPEESLRLLEEAQKVYLRHGITTVQDGFTAPAQWELLRQAAEEGRLAVDTIAYADLCGSPGMLHENRDWREYQNHLKLGGYKIFLDGSPQGRTAWMSEPYLGGEPGYRGYPAHENQQVRAYLDTALREGAQLLAHCNGDAAAQQFLDAYAAAREQNPGAPDIRPVMIHAQLLRRDQLPRLRALSMIASFFVAHVWHWGDVHLHNFGPARANLISPAASALREGVTFTFHQDTPVLPPDMLETLWCAVCRRTKDGVLLGESERITPAAALAAVTKNAAYQYFEEGRKGTLRPGKLADMVILDRDPLRVSPEEIRNIRVMETIKEGKTLYRCEE